ncbi:hypothetical protein [Helicobacter sp.]|nr:hypothetical protein [Helicobacter sp.]
MSENVHICEQNCNHRALNNKDCRGCTHPAFLFLTNTKYQAL